MALAYPFVGAEVPPPSSATAVAGLLTLLPKPFTSDIDMNDKGLGTREEETLGGGGEEVLLLLDFGFGFGKNKGGGGVDRGGNDDDDDDEEEEVEDEKVLGIVVEEPDELGDWRELATGILELVNEDGGGIGGNGGIGGGTKGFIAERFILVGEAGRDTDEGVVGDISEDVDVDTGEEDNIKWDLVGELVVELDCLVVLVEP